MSSTTRPVFGLGFSAATIWRGDAVSELRIGLDEILPIKEASRSLARAVDRVEMEDAQHLVITRRSRPAAVLIGVGRYEALLRDSGDSRA